MASLSWDKTSKFVDECFLKDNPACLIFGIIKYPLIPFVVMSSSYNGIKLIFRRVEDGK
jgi:hypothetical protein